MTGRLPVWNTALPLETPRSATPKPKTLWTATGARKNSVFDDSPFDLPRWIFRTADFQ